MANPLRRLVYGAYRVMPRKLRSRVVRMLTPNYTLGVVILVRDADGRLLLVRKHRESGWSLPGGLLGRREATAAAARRELVEETGLAVAESDLTPANPNAQINRATQQVDCVYTTVVTELEPQVSDTIELAACQWFSVEGLPPLTVSTAQLLAAYSIGPYVGYVPAGRVDV